jgi:hypothetical protein
MKLLEGGPGDVVLLSFGTAFDGVDPLDHNVTVAECPPASSATLVYELDPPSVQLAPVAVTIRGFEYSEADHGEIPYKCRLEWLFFSLVCCSFGLSLFCQRNQRGVVLCVCVFGTNSRCVPDLLHACSRFCVCALLWDCTLLCALSLQKLVVMVVCLVWQRLFGPSWVGGHVITLPF